jgi:hypothetical protein
MNTKIVALSLLAVITTTVTAQENKEERDIAAAALAGKDPC